MLELQQLAWPLDQPSCSSKLWRCSSCCFCWLIQVVDHHITKQVVDFGACSAQQREGAEREEIQEACAGHKHLLIIPG